jgi:guanylate kinase
MDICGAMSLKTQFKNVTTVFVKRDKRAVMENIIRKNSSVEDKVNRLAALEYVDKNAALCDYVISFETYDEAMEQLREVLK